MEVSQHSRRNIRLQNIVFYVLFLAVIGLLAWLSTRYVVEADWTASGRNTPSTATIEVVGAIEGPVTVTAFVSTAAAPMKKEIEQLLSRYQRYKPNLELKFVNPETEPGLVRELGIMVEGEMLVEYEGRSEKIQAPTEQALTNALQRLVRSEERWVVFMQGHGERDPHGGAGHDLRQWTQQLENKGIKVRALNLTTDPHIPDNTSVLVLASPSSDLLPGEVKLIENYLDKGGNLLWLADPGRLHGLRPIAEKLGIEFLPGTIVDPNTRMLGISDPRFALVADYRPHPLTQNFDMLTLFPQARGLEYGEEDVGDWDVQAFLDTLPRSWAETGELTGTLEMDAGEDIPGPLTIGYTMERVPPDSSDGSESSGETGENRQRVVIVGDGDFLSDTYLGQGGNLDLGMNIINWLSHDDTLIAIPAKTAPDLTLELSQLKQSIIGFGFLLALPLALLGAGIRVWVVRRKR